MNVARFAAVALLSAVLAIGCRREKAPVRSESAAVSASSALPVEAAAASASASAPPAQPASVSSNEEVLFAPSVPDAGDVDLGSEDSAARVASWVKAREAAVKGGDVRTSELVRLPLVRRGTWGCICPEYFIGTSTISAESPTTWIMPVLAPSAPPIPPDSIVIVEGYFTGKTTPFDPKTTEGYERATLHELRVLRHRPVTRDPNLEGDRIPAAEARLHVLLPAKDAHREREAPPDGKGFLLVALSVPISDPKAAETAERRRAELVAKGFAAAEVIDTRLVPGLFCCHLAVVASRHATASEADAAASDAKKKGVAVFVRRGW